MVAEGIQQMDRPSISPKIRQQLIDRVTHSPVTIVVGPTGCGKSTQVPSFLLDSLGGPILVTQPRRLAVVAVSTRVAEERNVVLGEEVGYHVGQANHSLSTTNLLFTTAGILLEELRAHGIQALVKYKVVVLDECHERSPEQELCLAMCKMFLLQKTKANKRSNLHSKIRLVLMSATFDHERYKSYFAGLEEPIDTITLETANMVDAAYERVETLYLEDTLRWLHTKDSSSMTQHSRFWESMKMDPGAELRGDDGGKSLSLELLSFVRSLVLQLDRDEPVSGVFIIFSPTYRHLEQIYDMLTAVNEVMANSQHVSPVQQQRHKWKVGVLHSSMDMEDCLQAMQPKKGKTTNLRRILLASAIADSSVTIPNVTSVIDLCRSLHVTWESSKRAHNAKTTWASQSICDQRKGRTGRTCPGRCFRMVTKGFFLQRLQPWDEPNLATSSCRNEILKLLCSVSSTSSSTDPIQILSYCLDPPSQLVIEDAFNYLQSIGACVAQSKKGSYTPTKMGDLLAALPFKVEDSQIIVAGAQVGLLYETLALRAILSHKPAPIVNHFGDNAVNEANMLCYYDQAPLGTAESLQMANLSAFLYWDVAWNQYRAKAAAEQFAVCTGVSRKVSDELSGFTTTATDPNKASCNVWKWCPDLEEKHSEWCRSHCINPNSVRGVADLMDSTLNVFYQAHLEPEWLRSANPTPLWRRFDEWKGRAANEYENTKDVLAMVYDFAGEKALSIALMSLSRDARRSLSEMTSDDILEVASLSSNRPVRVFDKPVKLEVACVHFLEGNCTFGTKCRNSHSPFAARPPCRFFAKGACARGDACIFSHDAGNQQRRNPETANVARDPMSSLSPCIATLETPDKLLDWFDNRSDGLCVLGDGNFEFTRSLFALGVAPPFSSDKDAQVFKFGSTTVLQLDATLLHCCDVVCQSVLHGSIDTFLWLFPFTGVEEQDDANEELVLATFHSVLELVRSASTSRQHSHDDPLEVSLCFVLQGDQLSRWNVMRSSMRTGWRLSAWGAFSVEEFTGYQPRRANGEKFPATTPRFYEFTMNCSLQLNNHK